MGKSSAKNITYLAILPKTLIDSFHRIPNREPQQTIEPHSLPLSRISPCNLCQGYRHTVSPPSFFSYLIILFFFFLPSIKLIRALSFTERYALQVQRWLFLLHQGEKLALYWARVTYVNAG